MTMIRTKTIHYEPLSLLPFVGQKVVVNNTYTSVIGTLELFIDNESYRIRFEHGDDYLCLYFKSYQINRIDVLYPIYHNQGDQLVYMPHIHLV